MARKIKRLLIFILLLLNTALGISQGLQFNSSEELIKDRTSYCVFTDDIPKFKEYLTIEFDLSIVNLDSYGYVLYIKDKGNDKLYNLTYYSKNDTLSYIEFSANYKEILQKIPINKKQLGNNKWQRVGITFDTKKDSIFISYGHEEYKIFKRFANEEIIPIIYFGKHDSYIDLPSMAIRNLHVETLKNSWHFLFNENEGNAVHDINGKLFGRVENPVWLINNNYHWQFEQNLHFNKVSTISYDKSNQRFIILNRDSVLLYYTESKKLIKHQLNQKCPVNLKLGMSFFNSINERIYVYEVNNLQDGETTIASLDLNNLTWISHSTDQLDMQKHHHNSFYNKSKNEFIIFGGYGNRRYSNKFYKIDLDKHDLKWGKLEFHGDSIPNRFFSGMAAVNNDELLIFGGYGNPLGDQDAGKVYYHDCYLINIKYKTTKKLWETDCNNESIVSSRNMIISSDSNYFYTIQYPEYISNTYLKLYRYSMLNGNCEQLGDSVHMVSERIRTNANLYLDKTTQRFFLVTQEFELNGSSNVKIYTLLSPPLSPKYFFHQSDSASNILIYIISLFIVLSLVLIVFISKKRRTIKELYANKAITNIDESKIENHNKNAVCLFGQFAVKNKGGRDITYMFSPRLLQLFLIVFLADKDKMTSNNIKLILWPDKGAIKAKNLLGVTINKLRKILAEIEGIELLYKNKQWFFSTSQEFYSDYHELKKLLLEIRNNGIDSNQLVDDLSDIITKGRFLSFTDFSYFDVYKSSVENEILKVIPEKLKESFLNKDYSLSIHLAKTIYYIDEFNECALSYEVLSYLKLNLDQDAKKRYNAFLVDYQKENNDDYPYTYHEFIKERAKELIKKDSFMD